MPRYKWSEPEEIMGVKWGSTGFNKNIFFYSGWIYQMFMAVFCYIPMCVINEIVGNPLFVTVKSGFDSLLYNF